MLDTIALALSVFAFAVLGAFVSDCARRPPGRLPGARRAPPPLRGRPLRALWMATLVLSFVGGLYGLTVREHRDVREGEAAAPPGSEAHRVLRLPFYVREERVATAVDGSFLRSSRSTRTQLPWAFLAVVALYAWGAAAADRARMREEDLPESRPDGALSPPSVGTAGRR
jgi:hypothetical protein